MYLESDKVKNCIKMKVRSIKNIRVTIETISKQKRLALVREFG